MRRAAATILDFKAPDDRVAELRRLPRLTIAALRLVRAASARHLGRAVALQVVAAAAVGVQLLIGREILRALVQIGAGAPVSRLYPWLGTLALSTALMGVVTAVTAYEQKLLVELTSRYAFDRIMDVAAAVDFESFEEPEFYDQLQRARTSGLYRLMDMVNSLLALLTSLLTSVVIAAVLFVLQPLLLVCALAAGVFPIAAAIRNGRESYAFEHGMTTEGRERQYLMELLTERDPAKELRIFGSSMFLRERYRALTDDRERRLVAFLRGRLRVALVGTAGGLVGTAVALGTLIVLLATGRLAVAGAMTAALAMQQLASRMNGLTTIVTRLIESGGFIDDFQRFLDLAGRAVATQRRVAPGRTAGSFRSLAVEGVSFRYPNTDRLVLDDVTVDVGEGEVVALVGENGSGKTTLVKLICQLYRPDLGRILWNGIDARELDPDEVRAEQTVLFQDYVRYHLSVGDNIVLGRPGADTGGAAMRAAAERAGADAYVDALPAGYGTRLGRQFYGGHELSGGQWQRLALARAFFRDGSFLVLDEPTASLDPRAEAELFAQMRELARGRSVLLVSHRLSSVRTADRIYLLEGGRVVEHGDHEALVAQGGRYAELVALQAEAHLAPTG